MSEQEDTQALDMSALQDELALQQELDLGL